MSVLDIVNYGDPILRKKCSSVEDFTTLPSFVDDMFDTMYEEEGLGLAANQVGVDMNLFIIDIAHTDDNEFPRVFINGEIISNEGESVFSEGCLSIPQVSLEVTRPETITYKFQDLKKQWHQEKFDGLLARAIQHEMDHLNGILIIDIVSDLQMSKVQSEVKKIKNESISKIKSNISDKRFVL
jgi:peptide deformylase|tara:strand:+ start:4215 stop:4763 length:549 start_codon:yes stop_codon:yes gene_type:complete